MNRSDIFWQTYLNLEKELLDVSKFIYLTDSRNGQLETFSPHIADLLVRTCIEIEAISKELYFDYGGEKARGDSALYFDEDCLKLIDKKCKTHKKVVMVTCPYFDFSKEENQSFRPLKEAHKRQGTDWERAYQALKHDRYSSINQGTVKNFIHALGALYLLNIYYRDVRMTSKFLDVGNLDLSLGSSIFSVKQPDYGYVLSIVNNQDIADILESKDSPFILKYTDSYYRQVLDANKTMAEQMQEYWSVQPELQEEAFVHQFLQAEDAAKKNPQRRYFNPIQELCKYRLNKRVPASLPFEERKRLFLSSPEWSGRIRKQNNHLKEDELTEANIQSEIDLAGVFAGMELQQRFESVKMNKAFNEGYCELVLDKGNVRYKQ